MGTTIKKSKKMVNLTPILCFVFVVSYHILGNYVSAQSIAPTVYSKFSSDDDYSALLKFYDSTLNGHDHLIIFASGHVY